MDWLLAVSYWLLAVSYRNHRSYQSDRISNNISLQGNLFDPRLSRISTWKISNLHVDIFYFPRGRDIKLRRNQMKLRKNQITPTWKIKNIHVEI